MVKRVVTALVITLMFSTGLSADQGAAPRRPVWTFVGIGAGFGVGLWAGLTAFDDSTDSDRKVWTSAIVGAAAGGVIGYLVDRHRAKPQAAPRPSSTLFISRRDERDVLLAAKRLGDGQLKRRLDALPGRVVNWRLTTDD